MLKDLGFILDFTGQKGYTRLQHPDLIVEFLVAEKGRGTDKPVPIPAWGLNATPLRFLGMLSQDVVRVKQEGFILTLPHPANFALHKLIVSNRRSNEDKAQKDFNTAVEILKALIKKGEAATIAKVFNSISSQMAEEDHQWA